MDTPDGHFILLVICRKLERIVQETAAKYKLQQRLCVQWALQNHENVLLLEILFTHLSHVGMDGCDFVQARSFIGNHVMIVLGCFISLSVNPQGQTRMPTKKAAQLK